MSRREDWHPCIPSTICWEAHKRAIKKLDATNKTRIQKFVHRCLPTNKKLHDINQEHLPKCPSCNCIETNEHVTSCNNTRRNKIRKTTKTNLAKMLDKLNTNGPIKECLLIGIERAFTENTEPIKDTELSFDQTPLISQALNEQQDIGWANFYRGRISKAWLIAQGAHSSKNSNQAKQDLEQWATKIITTIWHGFLQLWEERKQDQHGRDVIQQQATTRQNLLKRTRILYSKIHLYDTEDRRFFSTPLAHWEQASNKDMQDWITIAEPLVEKSISRATTRQNKNQPTITQYFSTTTREVIIRNAQTYTRRPPRLQSHDVH